MATTILDKTTWENVFINVQYIMQQNYFQINGFAQRKPPLPVQSCFLQMLRDPVFFWRPNNTASSGRGGGGGKNRSATKFRKNVPQICNFLNSFVQDCRLFFFQLSLFTSFAMSHLKVFPYLTYMTGGSLWTLPKFVLSFFPRVPTRTCAKTFPPPLPL